MSQKCLENTTTISVNINNFEILSELNQKAQELNRSWDELINVAIERLLNDIDALRQLRN